MLYATMLQYIALKYCLCLADEISYFEISLGSIAHSSFMDGQTANLCNLYGDAMLVPIRWVPTWWPETETSFKEVFNTSLNVSIEKLKKKLK